MEISEVHEGDWLVLSQSIYDDGEDHHPPGYCGYKGERVYVMEVRAVSLVVAHREDARNGFIIYKGEFEKCKD